MIICFTKWSSVINLIYYRQQVFSDTLGKMHIGQLSIGEMVFKQKRWNLNCNIFLFGIQVCFKGQGKINNAKNAI